MTYQNWTWLDVATEEQREDAANAAAVERLCEEARRLYDAIPEPSSNRDRDDDRAGEADEAAWEDLCDRVWQRLTEIEDEENVEFTRDQIQEIQQRAGDAYQQDKADQKKAAFGQLDAIEELMEVRGARFTRPYEHWNEDEQLMEYMERDRD